MHVRWSSVSREHAPVAILAADSKRSVLGGMDRDEELPISVRLAMCSAERERDPSGCGASCQTGADVYPTDTSQ